jgi:hypothetical protein
MSLIDRLPLGGSRKKSQNPLQRAMSAVSELRGDAGGGRGKTAKRGAGTRGRAAAQKRRRSRA